MKYRNTLLLAVLVGISLFDTRCGDLDEHNSPEGQSPVHYDLSSTDSELAVTDLEVRFPSAPDLPRPDESLECLALCNRFMECAFIPPFINVLEACIRDCEGHPYNRVNVDLDTTCDELRLAIRGLRVSS